LPTIMARRSVLRRNAGVFHDPRELGEVGLESRVELARRAADRFLSGGDDPLAVLGRVERPDGFLSKPLDDRAGRLRVPAPR
jgi:hypothetical protein